MATLREHHDNVVALERGKTRRIVAQITKTQDENTAVLFHQANEIIGELVSVATRNGIKAAAEVAGGYSADEDAPLIRKYGLEQLVLHKFNLVKGRLKALKKK
jgi:hypothetical protein